VPLRPDRRCLEWDNAWNDDDCVAQWESWDFYCSAWEWTDECEAVDEIWYSQDLDWLDPTPISGECLVLPEL